MKPVNRIWLEEKHAQKLTASGSGILLHPANDQEFYVSALSLDQIKKKKIPHRLLEALDVEQTQVELVYPSHTSFFEPPSQDAVHEALAYVLGQKKGRRNGAQLFYEGRHFIRKPLRNDQYFYLDHIQGRRAYLWRIPLRREKSRNIQALFPKIKRLVQNPDTRVVLSFGSGGIRLYAHPSLMKFINFMGLRDDIDEIWGCSGGAIAGMPYSLGVDPSLIEQEGYHLYNDRYSIRWSPHKIEVLKNILIDQMLPGSNHMLQGFMDCQQDLRDVFEKHIRKKNSAEKPIPFYCTAYNLRSKNLEILTPQKINKPDYPTPIFHTEAMDAVIASSSVPILYVPKKIMRGKTEHQYIDGGTIEELPLISVYQKWQEDRARKLETRNKLLILCVNLFPRFEESSMLKHWIVRSLPIARFLRLFVKYADLVRQSRITEHLKILKHDKDVKVLELSLPVDSDSVLDPRRIPEIIKTAHQSFFKQLLAHESSLPKYGSRASMPKIKIGDL